MSHLSLISDFNCKTGQKAVTGLIVYYTYCISVALGCFPLTVVMLAKTWAFIYYCADSQVLYKIWSDKTFQLMGNFKSYSLIS